MRQTSWLRCLTPFVLFVATTHAQDWPSFRGPNASGVQANAHPPTRWSVEPSANVAWRIGIPGLGHSSPIVSGDRVYLTSAISEAPASQAVAVGDSERAGIDPAADQVPHRWQLIALDRASGNVIWSRTVQQGVPRAKRHVKSSHASATPATNGRVIVAMLDSEGLFAFDAEGKELWRKDLGVLKLGLADDPAYEWGPASSPVIHGNTVLVQNDRYEDSYTMALDLLSGKELWRSRRDELPSWATPLVHESGAGTLTVVTTSPRFIRGLDFATGRERWRVPDPDGQVKVSTPIAAGELTIATGGYPSGARPIVAIRVKDGSIAWRHERGSPYTSTPLVYDGLLYIVTDNGILSAYQIADGARVYQTRLPPVSGSFSASPVAADGKIYLAGEDGQVFVVRAGRQFALLASNDMRELCMATPALSGDLLLIRTKTRLYALRGQ
jgi:outer membrane protein assembly factor BamB